MKRPTLAHSVPSRTSGQLIRFGVVGLVSNALLYALYLVARSLDVEHNLAMTAIYAVGVAQTFIANKSWSFRSRVRTGPALGRYLFAYVMAYLVNLAVSFLMVDRLGYPDKPVQGVMIFVVAALLFVLQKLWVFRDGASPAGVGGRS